MRLGLNNTVKLCACFFLLLLFKHKRTTTTTKKNIYCFYRPCCNPVFTVPFFFLFLPDIQGIPLWLCNMIWGKQLEKPRWKWKQRDRGGKHPVMLGLVHGSALVFLSPVSTAMGSWLIISLLSFFFCHAWLALISPVYCKLHLITLRAIKANILITACLIISSHWEKRVVKPELCNVGS